MPILNENTFRLKVWTKFSYSLKKLKLLVIEILLQDPSKFAAISAAPVAATDSPAAAAAAAPAKEEKAESESDDDMGFGLFD